MRHQAPKTSVFFSFRAKKSNDEEEPKFEEIEQQPLRTQGYHEPVILS
jgi:hypothetical protein